MGSVWIAAVLLMTGLPAATVAAAPLRPSDVIRPPVIRELPQDVRDEFQRERNKVDRRDSGGGGGGSSSNSYSVPYFGYAVALPWDYVNPFSTTSPTPPMFRADTLQPGGLYKLVCYAYGLRVADTYVTTNLWYRLVDGSYVNDGWLYTDTGQPIAGMSRC